MPTSLPYHLWLYIAEFVIPPCYNIASFIQIDKLNKKTLSKHPKAIEFLLRNPNFITKSICSNPHPKTGLLFNSIYDDGLGFTTFVRNHSNLFDSDVWSKLQNNSASWVKKFIHKFTQICDDSKIQHVCVAIGVNKICLPSYSNGDEIKAYNLVDYDDLSSEDKDIVRKYYGDMYNWNMFNLKCNYLNSYNILNTNPSLIRWSYLCENPSPYAIKLMKMHPNKINLSALSCNESPEAIEILAINVDKVNWTNLCHNTCPQAIELISRNLDKIKECVYALSSNESSEAIALLKLHPHLINWHFLSLNENPNVVELIEANLDKINLNNLVNNKLFESSDILLDHLDELDDESISLLTHPKAMQFLKLHPEKIDGYYLSANTSLMALEILKLYPQYIDWSIISSNSSPKAIELIESNLDKVHWDVLLRNSGATHLLRQHIDMIDYSKVKDAYFELDIIQTQQQYSRYLQSFNITP